MATALQEADVAAPEIVRAAELLGGLDIFDRPVTSSLDAHELISEGFPGAALTSLCENVTMIRDADTLEKAVGISLRTLHHWEQGTRVPSGAARVLLQVAADHPQAVLEAAA